MELLLALPFELAATRLSSARGVGKESVLYPLTLSVEGLSWEY